MYIHTYIHMYMHTHTYIHTYINTYIHMHIHKHIHTYVHTYTHPYVHTYIHTHTHTYKHTYIYMYIHTYTHTYVHIYIHIHTYIHTYTHTYKHTYIYTYICTYIRTNIHTYIHTYVHTYIPSYGAPVWIEAMKHQHNRQKLKRVQRLINLRMARAFRTTSGDALCILTGMKPIIIKIEEIVKQHEFKGRQPQREYHLDYEVEYRHWPHPATAVTIKEIDAPEESTIAAYTDGSKSEKGVGAGGSDILWK